MLKDSSFIWIIYYKPTNFFQRKYLWWTCAFRKCCRPSCIPVKAVTISAQAVACISLQGCNCCRVSIGSFDHSNMSITFLLWKVNRKQASRLYIRLVTRRNFPSTIVNNYQWAFAIYPRRNVSTSWYGETFFCCMESIVH